MNTPEIFGWVGKILRVDLTTREINESLTSDYVPKWIGGRGIGSMIYWEEVPPGCKAFDPENCLIIMTGPATGTMATASSRTYIGTKSPAPLNECYTFSVIGGHWGPFLKFAGYDGMVIKGKASSPVYLWVHDGQVQIKSADHLWGMRTRNTYEELIRLYDRKARALVIGPAGENLCREAVIGTDACHATGVGGAGAVMGSKKLKAIVVNGTGAVNVARPQELIDLCWHYFRMLNRKPGEEDYPAATKSLSYYMYHEPHRAHCPGFPAKPTDPAVYFKNSGLDDPISLMAEPVNQGVLKMKWAGCYACPVCCTLGFQSRDKNIPSCSGKCNGIVSWAAYEWAEYNKVIGIPSLWFLNHIEDLGLSVTNTCGYHFYWFFDLVHLGIITKENTGLPVDKPCSHEFIKGILEMVAYRKGIGDRIAEGQERFLKNLLSEHPSVQGIYDETIWHPGFFAHWTTDGKPGRPIDTTTKALFSATQVRQTPNRPPGGFPTKSGLNLAGLTFKEQVAVLKKGNLKYHGVEDASDIPGEPQSWKNKVNTAIVSQNLSINMDCIPMCGWANCPPLYSPYTADNLGDDSQGLKIFSAVTGIDLSQAEMMEAMDRVCNLERCIHVREGRRREHDIYPDAVFKFDIFKWTNKQEFEEAMDEYYDCRGWDRKTAIPRKSTLVKLGLQQISNELENKYGVPA